MDMCPLSRYCVNKCLHSNHCADRFFWFLAVSLIDYPEMYSLIYQPLSRQNNLSHTGLYSLSQLYYSLNAIFTMVGKYLKRILLLTLKRQLHQNRRLDSILYGKSDSNHYLEWQPNSIDISRPEQKQVGIGPYLLKLCKVGSSF